MTQVFGNEMQTFIRTIMPELYRLQEIQNRRREPKGGVYHLADPDDMEAFIEMVSRQINKTPMLMN